MQLGLQLAARDVSIDLSAMVAGYNTLIATATTLPTCISSLQRSELGTLNDLGSSRCVLELSPTAIVSVLDQGIL